MSDPTLLPCAFCGGDAEPITMDGWCRVSCRACGVLSPRCHFAEDAAKSWNRRAAPRELQATTTAHIIERIQTAIGCITAEVRDWRTGVAILESLCRELEGASEPTREPDARLEDAIKYLDVMHTPGMHDMECKFASRHLLEEGDECHCGTAEAWYLIVNAARESVSPSAGLRNASEESNG